MSISPTQQTYQPQGKTQATNYYQGPSYQVVGYFPPSTSNDEILKLHEMEKRFKYHGKTKLSYGSICNESIHPSILIKGLPYKFEVPKMDKFKVKEDPKEHQR